MQLTNDHIDYIIKDLTYRGIIVDHVRNEILDHICSAVETEMSKGLRFINAYQLVLREFGHTRGLRTTQKQIVQFENQTPRIMFRNYLTIAFRNLLKHRFFTAINIFGLAIGIASCLLITLYVLHELSYDKHFENADRVYRVDTEILFNGNHHRLAVGPAPLAEALMNDFPEVEAAVRFRAWGSRLIKTEKATDNIKERHVIFADNEILQVFPLKLLSGDAQNGLKEPNAVMISKSKADKYFPGQDAVGQTLILDNEHNYKVTGVFPDFPEATHFRFDFILAMSGLDESKNDMWLSNNFNTYFLLRKGASPADVEAKFKKMVETYAGPQIEQIFNINFTVDDFEAGGNRFQFSLMPLTRIHLHSDRTAELAANSDITYVYLFGAIALFILGIACINFMNLSTARSANRAREVGVRKVLGSLRGHLVRQFLTESILLSFIAFVIGLGLVALALPYFNLLSARSLEIPYSDPRFIGLMIVAAIVVGILAGIYPSAFLSGFKPVNVLKGKLALGMKSGLVRSSLVVFQFMVSIFLLIGTITVQKQLSFIQNKRLGFQKDQVLILQDTQVLGPQIESFKNEMLNETLISSASISGFLPVSGWGRSDTSFWPEGKQTTQDNLTSMQHWRVDHNYVKTLGMNVKAGRDFSKDFPSDSSAIIINEAAARKFGFANPVGERISTFDFSEGEIDPDKSVTYTIIGVVEDFHFESLRKNITPLGLVLGDATWCMSFRFESEKASQVIDLLESKWKQVAPGQPFQYTFLDEAFGKMYSSEERLGHIFGIFAGLAIVIACLGLFALTAFTAEQRTKEIGIRKVLGASVTSIVVLLSREFGKLIVIAFVIAAPISWFAVSWWLESYTYKAEIGLAIYVLAGLVAFVVAWLTMGYQSIRAATANPVNSLKSE
jgi:ABC-type transport system, involved in lipoprotein release, permease component